MADLLAKEKAHIVESQRILGDNEQLNQRLEIASVRYLMAEKKADRAKSGPVHKMESRAIMGGYSEGPSAKQKNSSKSADSADTNGSLDPSVRAASEAAIKEATALAETRRSQTEQLEIENKRLTEDLTAAQTRLVSFTDDDYAKTDLFKLLKSQHEDVIKRVNDLEATNVQLHEDETCELACLSASEIFRTEDHDIHISYQYSKDTRVLIVSSFSKSKPIIHTCLF